MKKPIISRLFWIIILMVGFGAADLALAPTAYAQSQFFNPRDDSYPLLGLRRAKEAYEQAKAQFERQQALFDKQLISQADFDRAQQTYSDAEVSYQQSLLTVIFENQYVTVERAIKYQMSNGRSSVRITLANKTTGSAEFQRLINIEDDLFRSLQPDLINNVYISLLNDENAIISRPYERKIEVLRSDQPETVSFDLLQDVDAISVNLIFGNGSQSSRKIYLEKDASANKVVVQSEQFAQEVELGASAGYQMSLQLFSNQSNTFTLDVVNLPQEVNRYFQDPQTQARLSQFKFAEDNNTRTVSLQVSLPERPTDDVIMDEPIPFYIVVIPRDQANQLGNIRNRQWTLAEIEALNIGYVRLELVPRGVGEILVRAQQLAHSIKPDETVEFSIDIVNEGSRRLDNVTIEAEPPLNWEKEVLPEVISALDIGREERVSFRLTPPDDIAPGRYDVRIRTESLADGQPIRGEDKTVQVTVEPEDNILGPLLIGAFILAVILGLVIFGIRLSRR